jgi:uncharacterized membrane protein (DUF4010 family)
MAPGFAEHLFEAGAAMAIGLVIGLEREHHEIERTPAPAGTLLGARTFTLLSLLGWLCAVLGEPFSWLPPAGAIAVGGLAVASFLATAREDRGLTTEVAALVTFALGMLAHRDRALAVALGLAATVLLFAKPWVTALVPKLRRVDFTSTLQLLVVLAVVLPLLPTEARDPWGVLSPRRIGLFVALIAAVDYVGYVLHRALGSRRGAGLTGLVGGLASSTAVTVAMARAGAGSEAMRLPGQLATLLASAVMGLRVLVLLAVVGRSLLPEAGPPMLALSAALAAGAAWKWRQLSRAGAAHRPGEPELEIQNPMQLMAALKWGLFLIAILVLSALGQQLLGSRGVLAAAALSGLADVDAITIALGRRAADGNLSAHVAAIAITLAAVTNTAVKAGIAVASGGRRFGRDVAIVCALAGAAAAGAAAIALR